MIASSITPGPWHVYDPDFDSGRPSVWHGEIGAANERRICSMGHGLSAQEAKANAQAISCLPELLETLTEAAGTLAACAGILGQVGHSVTAEMLMEQQAKCVAVLVKATKEPA